MISFPLSIHVYAINGGEEQIVARATSAAGLLLPCVFITWAIFLLSIERKYISTFLSLERSKDALVERFRDAEEDDLKADAIFNNSKRLWAANQGEVQDWVETNYAGWVKNKPMWFNERMQQRIPLEFIPKKEMRDKEQQRRQQIMSLKTMESSPFNQVIPVEGEAKEPAIERTASSSHRMKLGEPKRRGSFSRGIKRPTLGMVKQQTTDKVFNAEGWQIGLWDAKFGDEKY